MTQSPDSDVVTQGIRVQASGRYLPDESDPDRSQFLFAYRIQITNEGDRPVRLLARHWIILYADNVREDVQGDGVVGEQPELQPGESHEYMSGCPLGTTWGTMEGSYTFEVTGDGKHKGETFEAKVGRFFLVSTLPSPA